MWVASFHWPESWVKHKGESELSAGFPILLCECGGTVTNHLKRLLSQLLRHEGPYPQAVSQDTPSLPSSALAGVCHRSKIWSNEYILLSSLWNVCLLQSVSRLSPAGSEHLQRSNYANNSYTSRNFYKRCALRTWSINKWKMFKPHNILSIRGFLRLPLLTAGSANHIDSYLTNPSHGHLSSFHPFWNHLLNGSRDMARGIAMWLQEIKQSGDRQTSWEAELSHTAWSSWGNQDKLRVVIVGRGKSCSCSLQSFSHGFALHGTKPVTRCGNTVQWWEAEFSTIDSSQVVSLEQYLVGPLLPSFIVPF